MQLRCLHNKHSLAPLLTPSKGSRHLKKGGAEQMQISHGLAGSTCSFTNTHVLTCKQCDTALNSAHGYSFENMNCGMFSRTGDTWQTFVILFQAHITNFNDLCQVNMKSPFRVFFRDFSSLGLQVSSKFCSLKRNTQNSRFVNSDVKVTEFLTDFSSTITSLPLLLTQQLTLFAITQYPIAHPCPNNSI